MALYGVSIYGTTTYGTQAFSTLIANAFVAVPQGYGSLLLSWEPPGGSWSHVRLVRSSFGFPSTIDEGTVLFADETADARLSYLDGALREGRFYYYSLFVLLDPEGTWHRVASTFELIPENYGFGERLYELIPQVHRSDDALNSYQLQRFLALFGYQLDRLRTEIRTLLDVANIDYVSGGLLPVLAASLGVTVEPELGMITTRRILKNSVYLSKIRGTKPGIEGIASAYTGWGATTAAGKNLAFDYNDSGYVESTGHWTAKADCALDRVATPAPDDGTGVLRITCDGGDPAEYVLGDVDTKEALLPATAGLDYSVSLDVRTEVTSRTRRLAIAWLDADKVVLSTTAYATVADGTGSWTALTQSGTAPANTKWMAVLCEVVAPAADEVHYQSAFQVEQAAAPTDWESAREIIIYFDPERENILPNPSAETDTTGWAAYGTTTLTQATGDGAVGTASFRLQNTSGGAATIGMNTPTGVGGFEVEELTTYALIGRVRAETAARDARVAITWYDSGGSAISTDQSDVLAESGTDWSEDGGLALLVTAPAGAVTASVAAEVISTADLEYHRVDAMLFEQTNEIGEYFDGATLSTDDHLWTGTAHASASRYYSRRTMKVVRLGDVMPKHIPLGVTFRSEFSPVP